MKAAPVRQPSMIMSAEGPYVGAATIAPPQATPHDLFYRFRAINDAVCARITEAVRKVIPADGRLRFRLTLDVKGADIRTTISFIGDE